MLQKYKTFFLVDFLRLSALQQDGRARSLRVANAQLCADCNASAAMPDVTAAEFAHGIATCQRLDDVVAAPNAAVADYLQAVVQRVGALQAGGNP